VKRQFVVKHQFYEVCGIFVEREAPEAQIDGTVTTAVGNPAMPPTSSSRFGASEDPGA
jgi:hypothetical protein